MAGRDGGRESRGVIHQTTTPSGVQIAFEDGTDGKRRGYRVDGKVFPSVTTILGVIDKWGPLMHWAVQETKAGRDYRETRDTAATRGTSVHDALEVLATEGTPPSLTDFPEEDRGYVSGLCSWWLDHEPKAVLVEQIVASKRLRFAGRFDLLAVIDGTTHLLDLKTSGRVYETHHLQAVAYAAGVGGVRLGSAGGVFDLAGGRGRGLRVRVGERRPGRIRGGGGFVRGAEAGAAQAQARRGAGGMTRPSEQVLRLSLQRKWPQAFVRCPACSKGRACPHCLGTGLVTRPTARLLSDVEREKAAA